MFKFLAPDVTKELPGEHKKKGMNEEVFSKGIDSHNIDFFNFFFKPAPWFLDAQLYIFI